MLNVPTISLGGEMPLPLISETKFAVMPTIISMEIRERPRTRRKVWLNGKAP